MTETARLDILSRYGRRLHAVAGDSHHVVSPLGAWIVVALCGGLAAEDPTAREELAPVLGDDPAGAADFAGRLLADPHPLVAAGAGLWVRSDLDNARIRAWRSSLPDRVDTGDIPTQEQLDGWAADRSLGLIRRFPLNLTPQVALVLASALATKVSWEVPFRVVDAAELGPSRWEGALRRVLRTPNDPRHRQFIADTEESGPVAVHLTASRGGLLVGSVIASDESVPPGRVLADAETIVTAEARQPGSVPRLSLFDLPLGAGPVWTISEESRQASQPVHVAERFTSVLPAWSADSILDLTATPELGFPAAARSVARALGLVDWGFSARQAAVARYSAVGFEAAAITGMFMLMSSPAHRSTPARRAVTRFRHPYAVVAATYRDPRRPGSEAWDGLPVFSAWVSRPEDAVAEEAVAAPV